MTTASSPASELVRAVRQYLELGDDLFPIVPLVVAVANRLPGPPVWLVAVAPSSSGKTELIAPVSKLEGAFLISKITDKTLVSGKKREAGDARYLSLLERLDSEQKWLLIVRDLGTILTLPQPVRDGIFGQLREVYDGQFNATFGTGVAVEWTGKLGLLAAATDAIDRYAKFSTELGERLVYFRPTPPARSLVALRAWHAVESEEEQRRIEALSAAYRDAFYAALKRRGASAPGASPAAVVRCMTLAEFVVEARTPIDHRLGVEVGQPEGASRLIKVLSQLFKAALLCYAEDEDAALDLVIRVGADSIPLKRRSALRALAASPEGLTRARAAEILRCDLNTAERHIMDLVYLGLAECEKPVRALVARPSEKLLRWAEAIYLDDLAPGDALRKLLSVYTDYPPARVAVGV